MDFIHTVKCRVTDNGRGGRKLTPYDEKEMHFALLRFNPDTDVFVGFKQYRAKHSQEAQGYLHGVIIPMILHAMGFYDTKENHENMYGKLKEKCGICDTYVGKDGEVFFMAKKMGEANTLEYSRLIDGAIQWGGEYLGITFPPPDKTMVKRRKK